MSELNRLKAILDKHFVIDDWQAVDLLLGISAAHYVSGEMLWVYLVGASRSLKTEMLRAIASHPDCVKTEVITPAALRGGYKQGPKLLSRLDKKLAITKEFASILTAKRETRTELAGALRNVADGEYVADYGSEEGHLEQRAKFDWIIATTRVVERQKVFEEELGTRFLILRWGAPIDRRRAAIRAGDNNPVLPEIRAEVSLATCQLLDQAKHAAAAELPDYADREWIACASDTLAILRTPVPRDSRSRGIMEIPEPEAPTSIQQNFVRVIGGLRALGIVDYKPYIARLVWDGIPGFRAAVLRRLLCSNPTKAEATRATGRAIGISHVAVHMIQEDLAALGIYLNGKFEIDTAILELTNGEGRLRDLVDVTAI